MNKDETEDAIERMGAEHTERAIDALLVEVRNGDAPARLRILHIAQFARRKFMASVESLLDDPSFLLHPEENPAEYLDGLYKLASALGLDLSLTIDSLGTQFERERLRDIIRHTTEDN
jgi:hypothetical protein